MSLRFGLPMVLMAALVSIVGIHGVVRARRQQHAGVDTNRENLDLVARTMAGALQDAIRKGRRDAARRLLGAMTRATPGLRAARVLDRSLMPIAVAGDATAPSAPSALRAVLASAQSSAGEGPHRQLDATVPVAGPDGRPSAVVQAPAGGLDVAVGDPIRRMWTALGLVALTAAVVSTLVVEQQVLRPLARLARDVRGARPGMGPPGPAPPRADEVGVLAGTFADITGRLETAHRELVAEGERAVDLERLRQAETLAVAGKLASSVAHEIGTPLNIISGRAEFVLQTLPPADARRRDLTAIVAQIDRISGIIRSLLDTVRPQPAQACAVAPAALVEAVWPLVEPAARRRGLTLSASVAPDLPCILGDPPQLQQVLINLLVNAFEASPAGGRVRVTAERRAEDGADGVALVVADTGQGIAPEVLGRVFDPFFSTKPRGQGTGLGLAISRDIVRHHGGRIAVRSASAGGTTVTTGLPCAGGVA